MLELSSEEVLLSCCCSIDIGFSPPLSFSLLSKDASCSLSSSLLSCSCSWSFLLGKQSESSKSTLLSLSLSISSSQTFSWSGIHELTSESKCCPLLQSSFISSSLSITASGSFPFSSCSTSCSPCSCALIVCSKEEKVNNLSSMEKKVLSIRAAAPPVLILELTSLPDLKEILVLLAIISTSAIMEKTLNDICIAII